MKIKVRGPNEEVRAYLLHLIAMTEWLSWVYNAGIIYLGYYAQQKCETRDKKKMRYSRSM